MHSLFNITTSTHNHNHHHNHSNPAHIDDTSKPSPWTSEPETSNGRVWQGSRTSNRGCSRLEMSDGRVAGARDVFQAPGMCLFFKFFLYYVYIESSHHHHFTTLHQVNKWGLRITSRALMYFFGLPSHVTKGYRARGSFLGPLIFFPFFRSFFRSPGHYSTT
jgi:hypothetical protein